MDAVIFLLGVGVGCVLAITGVRTWKEREGKVAHFIRRITGIKE